LKTFIVQATDEATSVVNANTNLIVNFEMRKTIFKFANGIKKKFGSMAAE